MNDKKYLITGGDGQLGNAFKEILSKEEALFTDVKELDVTDEKVVRKTVKMVRPKYVLHLAAMTNVDECEENPELCEKINSKSVKYFANACNDVGATLFYISTDYVFKGKKDSPYKVDEEALPQSVYGKTKLEGEKEAKKAKKHYIFRTSWVYGDGHNFVNTMLALSEKFPEVKVVGDQEGRPTSALDLANAMKEALGKKIPFGTYHYQNEGNPVSWAAFAEKIYELAGKKTKVTSISGNEYLELNSGKQIAKRPNYSVLDLEKTKEAGLNVPFWEESLEKFLNK